MTTTDTTTLAPVCANWTTEELWDAYLSLRTLTIALGGNGTPTGRHGLKVLQRMRLEFNRRGYRTCAGADNEPMLVQVTPQEAAERNAG